VFDPHILYRKIDDDIFYKLTYSSLLINKIDTKLKKMTIQLEYVVSYSFMKPLYPLVEPIALELKYIYDKIKFDMYTLEK
jgi:hypothetical protein